MTPNPSSEREQADQAPLRIVVQDDQLMYRLTCPECGHTGEIDDEQARGDVSCDHSGGTEVGGCGCGCTYHATRDWLTEFRDSLDWSPVFRQVAAGRCTLGGAARFLACSDKEVEDALRAWEAAS